MLNKQKKKAQEITLREFNDGKLPLRYFKHCFTTNKITCPLLLFQLLLIFI